MATSCCRTNTTPPPTRQRVEPGNGASTIGAGVVVIVAGVESPSGHHRCRRRGSLARRGRSRLRRLEGVGVQAGGPLPGRGRRRVRASLAATEDVTDGDPRHDGRADRRAAPPAGRPGSRCRRGHDRLAPRTPPPAPGVASDDRPHPAPPRSGHAGPGQAAPLVLHPLRSRAAQRDVAGRLHPLPRSPPASTSRSCPGSTTTPATPCRSPPTAGSPAPSWSTPSAPPSTSHGATSVDADRQRHGVHHPPVRRHRRPQRLRDRTAPPRHHPEELADPTTPPPAARSNASNRP